MRLFCVFFTMAVVAGCSPGFGQIGPTTAPNGKFIGSYFRFAELQPTALAASTQSVLYVNDGGKLDQWKAVYAESGDGLGPCVGGTREHLYFTRDLFADGGISEVSLECFSPKLGVQRIIARPVRTRFAFGNESNGFYFDREAGPLHITSDGGKTWQEFLPTPAAEKKPSEATWIHRATWASPTEIAIQTNHGLIACAAITDKGNVTQRWAKYCAKDAEIKFASDDAGIWLNAYSTSTVLRVADGTLAATYESFHFAPGTVVAGKRIFAPGADGVQVINVTPNGLTPVTVIPVKSVKAIFPQGEAEALIVGDDGALYIWHAKENRLDPLQPQIDNEAIRNALKPPPDRPTPEEIQAWGNAGRVLPKELLGHIVDEGNSHKEWNLRQRIIWETEEFKKSGAVKPATVPETPSVATKPSTRP